MKRKDFITTTALGLASSAFLSSLSAQEHNHMNSGKMSTASGKYAKAMMSAVHCRLSAEICLSHCIVEMSNGDKSLGACAKSTKEVIAACDAFLELAASNSEFTKKMAGLCKDICDACAKECKKHSDHHKECKECMDSCNACSKEMAKV